MVQSLPAANNAWEEHFTIQRGVAGGLTAIGRTTVYVLNMNTERRIELRLALRHLEGEHWWRR